MDTGKTIKNLHNLRYRLVLEGIGTGILAGVLVSLFRLLISQLEELRGFFSSSVAELALFSFSMWVVIVICLKLVPDISGSGIPHVKGELSGKLSCTWYKVLPAKIAGAACAIGAGLSVGREGPSVQIGAMSGKGFSKMLKRPASEERILITAGAGAGLAAAFNAPLAGAIFALEEVHRNLSTEILMAAMSASIASDVVSSYVFGLSPVFSVSPDTVMPLSSYWLFILLGILLGLSGFIYVKVLSFFQRIYDFVPWMPVKIAVPVILSAMLVYKYPMVLGGGNSLVDELASGNMILFSLVILLLMKFFFSMISFGSGTAGGIFLPLLVLGALHGSIFAQLTGYDEYLSNFIILAMAGYFTAIVKSPVTGIILISEMTESLSQFLPLAIVCLISYLTADLLKSPAVYDKLLERILSKKGSGPVLKRRKTILESYVQSGSLMDGMFVRDLSLPEGVLIISIERDGIEIVPNGNTMLLGNDNLLVLCDESLIVDTEKILNEHCRRVVV